MSTQPIPTASPKRAIGTIVAVSLTILVLAAAAVWFLFFRATDNSGEQAAYDAIVRYQNEEQLDSLTEALDSYLDTYSPDAFHYTQLQELHHRISAERADWQTVEASPSTQAVRQFLDSHPDGIYLPQARRALDSLAYVDATRADTREAYDRYLSLYPGGLYAEKARKHLGQLDNADLSSEEKTQVEDMLRAHFNALASNDRSAMESTLAPHVNSYIGKADPELEDIYVYMRRMHSTSGRTIVFLVKRITITKVKLPGQTLYNAQFALDEENYATKDFQTAAADSTAAAPAPTSVQHFAGTAILDGQMHISSLVLRQ